MAKQTFKKGQRVDSFANYIALRRDIMEGRWEKVYLLDGEEGYFIDELLNALDQVLLTPEEKDFNLITLYGKEISWSDVANAVARYPMFGERTVVVLREATQLKDIDQLESYLSKPNVTTTFIIDYRGKKADGKLKWVKAAKDNGAYFNSEPLFEEDVPNWIKQYAYSFGIEVKDAEAQKLQVHLGTSLQSIANEIDKVRINEPNLSLLSSELIEKYIGISRSYDMIELPKIIFDGDVERLASMLNYFVANPKAAPMPAVLGVFYPFIERVYRCYSVKDDFSPESKALYYQRKYAQKYSITTIHKAIAILQEFSLKTVGKGTLAKDGALLKEFCGKLYQLLH